MHIEGKSLHWMSSWKCLHYSLIHPKRQEQPHAVNGGEARFSQTVEQDMP